MSRSVPPEPRPALAGPGVGPSEKPELLQYLVVGMLMVYVWRIQDLYPILASVKLPILLSVATLVVFVAGGAMARSGPRLRHRIVTVAAAILGLMILSVPGSVYQGLSFRFILDDHGKTMLLMIVLIASVRGFADVERLVVTQVVGAGIYCFLILTRFEVGPSGRLGDLEYYDANDLAMLIVCTLPLAVYFMHAGSKAWYRLVALLCALVFLVAIVRTGSRGGFLGLVAVGVYLLIGFRAIRVVVRVGAAAVLVLLLTTIAGPRYWEMMSTILHPTQDYNWSSNNEVGRMAIWQRGMGYMAQRPVFGVGVNAFPVAEGTLSAISERQSRGIGLKWSAAHNSFVQIGAELGVPGLLAFLLLLWYAFRESWTLGRPPSVRGPTRRGQIVLGQALVGSLIGYVISGFLLSQAYAPYLYATFAIVVGLATVAAIGEPDPAGAVRIPAPARRPAPRRAVSATLLAPAGNPIRSSVTPSGSRPTVFTLEPSSRSQR